MNLLRSLAVIPVSIAAWCIASVILFYLVKIPVFIVGTYIIQELVPLGPTFLKKLVDPAWDVATYIASFAFVPYVAGVLSFMAGLQVAPQQGQEKAAQWLVAVSYTHLTLPTILRV